MHISLDRSRQQLLDSLRGCEMVIPDLQAIFERWPLAVNPHLGTLSQELDENLEMLFSKGDRLRQLKAIDIASLAASWWPYASLETLRIATYLSIWLFAWDDEIDSAEFSDLVYNMDQASEFRRETIEYIKKCLAATVDGLGQTIGINASFAPVGQAIYQSCTLSQRTAFLKELEFMIKMTHVEQEYQMRGELPSVEEYMRRRMGSSAVGVCLAIHEYCLGVTIPPEVMGLDDMQALWHETNVIISATNDLFSVKKEIAQDQVDSLIPLLYERHKSLQGAVDDAVDMIRSSARAFETASAKLLNRYVHDIVLSGKVQLFIYSCQTACTANLDWSLYSGRYGIASQSKKNGIEVTL